ncbi:MAG: hypothetical protein ACXVHW_08065 [Methanobacterium sp.]
MKYIAMGIILILVLVAALSYTILDSTPSSNVDPASDIYLQSISSPVKSGGDWVMNAWISSKSHKQYNDVIFIATGYSEDNQVIDDKKFEAKISNQDQTSACRMVFPDTGKPLHHITIKVVNATPAS